LIYGDIKMGAARDQLAELAASFGSRSIPEPAFVARVPEFFSRVKRVFGPARVKAQAVMQAVRRLEFAALRGEGDRNAAAKHVELVSEDGSKTPVFVETDDDDIAVWNRLVGALSESDRRTRISRLRALRAEIGARVVEVPNKLAPPRERLASLVHISRAEFDQFYDLETGWLRPTPSSSV
jgi:hypothetical protein